MELIRCTGKLQKEMGLKKKDLFEEDLSFSGLGPWHANLIHIDSRKCVLFVNDITLFNFIAADVRRREIRELDALFRTLLRCVLSEEGLDDLLIEQILSAYDKVRFAKTNNRSVLGSLNDLALHYKFHIQREGGVHSPMVPAIISKLNRMPMGALKYVYPIEALKAMFESVDYH